MRLLNRVRSAASSIMRPVAAAVAATGITPNQITVIGLGVSLLSAFAFYRSEQLLGGVLLLAAGFFDVLDGAVARAAGRASRWGAVLDSVLDRYSDLVVLGAILISGLCDPVAGVAAMVGSVMISYVRSRGEVEGIKMSSVGLMERAERMLLLSASALVGYAWAGIILLAILTQVTVIQRLYHIHRSMHSDSVQAPAG